jgi:proline dehydrogenase
MEKPRERACARIARELDRVNIRTPRGREWYACTVKAQLGGAA